MRRRLAYVFIWVVLVLFAAGCKAEAPVSAQLDADGLSAGFRRTVLYYPDDSGHMVPIMKYIPWEEGIGRATLNYLKDGGDNSLSAQRMGLNTVIPENVEITLRIRDGGAATVDLKGFTGLEDAAAERAMVTAIVNTLAEFPAVETVCITVDGESRDALGHGTDISGPMEAFDLNQEEGEVSASTDGAVPITLFFPNISASLNVPVTRYTAMEPTLEVRISSLISGPAGNTLLNCFPDGTSLLSAQTVNNIAVLDFSREFAALGENRDMLSAAYDALYLTAAQAGGIYALDIYVEGEPFDMGAASVNTPVYPNEFR